MGINAFYFEHVIESCFAGSDGSRDRRRGTGPRGTSQGKYGLRTSPCQRSCRVQSNILIAGWVMKPDADGHGRIVVAFQKRHNPKPAPSSRQSDVDTLVGCRSIWPVVVDFANPRQRRYPAVTQSYR